ncbi:reactive chlorine-specific transcriptional regulator RclR [Raoultella planticola]|uniref:reactive chlorine-specific transcriptional regulator RclR n=1 Tax=Raoultella planticola TaxID=575 RepID=UPI000515F643|nr:reactive chlorine-specific transcriptional regulator RclR [Raoultella planticola]
MDALSRLLMLNVPEGSIDKNCLLDNGWQLPHSAGELSVIRWHTVTKGAARMDMPASEPFTLRPGIVVFLTQNSTHRLSQLGDEQTHIVCGSLRFPLSARYFLTAMPEVLYLAPESQRPAFHWLKETILFLQQESNSALPGTDALRSLQCATLFTLAVRDWIIQTAAEKNHLNLLLHPRLGTVIQQMLENPSYPWTVKEFARLVHMSRASFAQLFSSVSGSTPLTVLTRLRMQIAAQALSREVLPVVVVAESVGYASESAFHKAFVREFNCTPGVYRKRVKYLEAE